METRTCLECGSPFRSWPSRDQKFCSWDCYRKHQKFERSCQWCGKSFVARNSRAKYCSPRCLSRATYHHDLERARLRQREWAKNHHESISESRRRYTDKLQSVWYGLKKPKYLNHMDEIVVKSEEYACEILKNEGFEEIILTRNFSAFFPCDILCKKNGEKYAVEVTLSFERKLNKRIRPLLEFFDLKPAILHIKPDFSCYYLKILKRDDWGSSIETILTKQIKEVTECGLT